MYLFYKGDKGFGVAICNVETCYPNLASWALAMVCWNFSPSHLSPMPKNAIKSGRLLFELIEKVDIFIAVVVLMKNRGHLMSS